MQTSRSPEFLRSIPPLDEVLSHPVVSGWREAHPRFPWTPFLRGVVEELRTGESVPADPGREALLAWIVATAETRLAALTTGGLKPVLNGTGVILHTNLGRAPLGARATAAGTRALSGYVSLEVDLATGERSRRADTIEALLCLATGAEAAMVVNNNAAAVYLVAGSIVAPGRLIVSRGELVEIGGSFRLPEILCDAAREVIEVGTTNRTYVADYEEASRPGDLWLKVHKSNYEITGFAHEASISELVEASRRRGCEVVYDLGSGAVFDFAAAGVGGDPVVSEVIALGVDAVTMSGDKLLGGAQAGVVAGRSTFIGRLRQNPLRRAVRIDKVAVAVLQEVMRAYLFDRDPRAEIPALAMITADAAHVRERAQSVASRLRNLSSGRAVTVEDDDAAVGGGSLSHTVVASAAVSIRCASERDASRLARALRLLPVPVFTRVRGDEVRINMSTILPAEDETLVRALADALSGDHPRG